MSVLTFKSLSAELTQAISSQLDVPEGTQARCTLGREKVMVLVESPSEGLSLEPEETLDWLEQSLRQQFDTVGLPEEAAELSESGDAVPVQIFLKYSSEPKPFTAHSFTWQVSDSFDDLFGDDSEDGNFPAADALDEPISPDESVPFQDATGSLSASYDTPATESVLAEPVDVFADVPDADSFEGAGTLSSMELLLSEEDDSVPLELDEEHLHVELEPDELESDELEPDELESGSLDAIAVTELEDAFLPPAEIDNPDLSAYEIEQETSLETDFSSEPMPEQDLAAPRTEIFADSNDSISDEPDDFSLPGDEPEISSSDLDLPTVDLPVARSQESTPSDEGFFDFDLDRVSGPATASDSELAAEFEEAFDRTHGEAAEIAAADLVEDIFDSSLNALEEVPDETALGETLEDDLSNPATHEIVGFEPSTARTDLLLELDASPVKVVGKPYGLADRPNSSDRPEDRARKLSEGPDNRDDGGDREPLEDNFDFLTPDLSEGLSDAPSEALEDEDAPGEEIFESSEVEPDAEAELDSEVEPDIDNKSFEALSSADDFSEEALSEAGLSEAGLSEAAYLTDSEEVENRSETAVGFDQYGSDQYISDDDELTEHNDSLAADDEAIEDLPEGELYQLERDADEFVLDEDVALIDEREVQRQREQWQQQTRSNPWIFAGAIGFFVIGLLGFVLTRPCSFGACPRLQTARSEGERALSSLTLGADLEAVKSAKKQLNSSVRQLQPIPIWSPHYQEAKNVLPEFERQLSALDRVTTAQEEAYAAAVASQNPPHSADDWGKIARMWRGAIATLEKVPADNSVRRLAEQKLTEYRANLSTIKVRIDAEARAEERLQAAQTAASLATATAAQASSLEAWETALESWESAVDSLGSIPKGTLAYADAQNLLTEYRQQMETVRDRTLQERNASKGLSRAKQLAADAERVEAEDQWTVAVQTWTAAVKQVQDLAEGTLAHREAQPLIGLYSQSLEKAESNRQVSQRFQPVEPSFYAACGATSAKRCSYSVRGGNVRLDLFQGYDSAINQSITPPDQRGEVMIDSDVVTQSNQLLKEITLLSTQAQVPIELYDAKGEFLARYRPDLSGFVKERET